MDKLILGIETSCDDTCVAVVKNGQEVLSNVISSQFAMHKKYGGVVPEIAARDHIDVISIVLKEALAEAKIKLSDLDAIAVTKTPGLQPSLVIGISFARGLAQAVNKPLLEINHLEAHVYSNQLYRDASTHVKLEYPHLALLVSGGHTQLWLSSSPKVYKYIGGTRDDAAGEAYDKVARMLGLGFPGGPAIDKLAKTGDEMFITFPRPMLKSNDYDFSFSGLKTAVRNEIMKYNSGESEAHVSARADNTKSELELREIHKEIDDIWKSDIAASFQEAVVDVLVTKTIDAAKNLGLDTIVIGGGVSANSRLREKIVREAYDNQFDVRIPDFEFCLDNAAMIAGLGYWHLDDVKE